MSNPIDDAFNAADRERRQREQHEQQAALETAVYESQVEPLVRSCIDAVRVKAEAFNAEPRNTNKAAVMANGTPAVVRRASDTGIPERRIEINFRRDTGEFSWKYEMTPSIHAEYDMVDGGLIGFDVVGGQLRLAGIASPQAFADMVLDGFIRDCAMDYARRS
jgi:hypothetical protein